MQRKAAEAARNPQPLPQGTNNQVLTITPFIRVPQNHVQPREYQGAPKLPPFLGSIPPFYLCEPLFRPLIPPTMTGQEVVSRFHLLQANFYMQGRNKLGTEANSN